MRTASIVPFVVATSALVLAWTAAQSAQVEPFEREARAPVAHVDPSMAEYGLCGTQNIIPTALFLGEYTDRVGHHYHGWLPPAGPPHFELCLMPPDGLTLLAQPGA
jgi:hypothetical protein